MRKLTSFAITVSRNTPNFSIITRHKSEATRFATASALSQCLSKVVTCDRRPLSHDLNENGLKIYRYGHPFTGNTIKNGMKRKRFWKQYDMKTVSCKQGLKIRLLLSEEYNAICWMRLKV